MTSLDITVDNLELNGWPFTNKNSMKDHPLTKNLKEIDKKIYRRAIRLGRMAVWKTRRSKFKRYENNLIKYFKECDYV